MIHMSSIWRQAKPAYERRTDKKHCLGLHFPFLFPTMEYREARSLCDVKQNVMCTFSITINAVQTSTDHSVTVSSTAFPNLADSQTRWERCYKREHMQSFEVEHTRWRSML
jgi:hypothetical protein